MLLTMSLYTNTTILDFARPISNVLMKVDVVLLLLVTSDVLFQSMLPLKDNEFVPKDAVNAFGCVRISLILKF